MLACATFLQGRSIIRAEMAPSTPASARLSRETNLLTSSPLGDGYLWQGGECSCQLGLVIGTVLELARLVVDVSLHVEVPVTAEIEQNRARDAILLTA